MGRHDLPRVNVAVPGGTGQEEEEPLAWLRGRVLARLLILRGVSQVQ